MKWEKGRKWGDSGGEKKKVEEVADEVGKWKKRRMKWESGRNGG